MVIRHAVSLRAAGEAILKTPQKEEIDIIHTRDAHLLPVEIKIKEQIGKEDTKALFKFMERQQLHRALLITLNTDTTIRKDHYAIEAIPYWRYWSIMHRVSAYDQ